jgi:hypothetical protein
LPSQSFSVSTDPGCQKLEKSPSRQVQCKPKTRTPVVD